MGYWGTKTFENDAALDWVCDLKESNPHFLINSLRRPVTAKAKVDIDNSLEGLCAAEVTAAARHDPPSGIPAEARLWIKQRGFNPGNHVLALAIRAVEKIYSNSELRESWFSSSEGEAWLGAVSQLLKRLRQARTLPVPRRIAVRRAPRKKTLAEMILEISPSEKSERRRILQERLLTLPNPDKVVGGKNLNNLTPMHWVASRGLLPEAEILIKRGAKVDVEDVFNARPILFALKNRHDAMAKLLVRAGSDKTYAFRTALGYNRVQIAKWLVSLGIDPKRMNKLQETALHRAAETGAMDVLEWLIKLRLPINHQSRFKETALHMAVSGKQLKAVEALLAHGAKVNLLDFQSNTPLDIAAECRYRSICQVLSRYGGLRASELGIKSKARSKL